jgi:cobalt-zinc-cadmium efflux system protein
MSHDHCHGHVHLHRKQSKALTVSLWIAAVFMVVEVVGGFLANSLALISDALHLFADVGALFLGLIALRIAKWPSTRHMSYGYARAEILGALASALSLWVLSGVLIYEAVERLFHPVVVQGPIVFVIATIGLLANLAMMRQLHPMQGDNLNLKAAYLHVLGDMLGSIGVILSGVILWLTQFNAIDPIFTILFSCTILYSSGKIIKQTVCILMERAPKEYDIIAIQNDLLSISGVKEVHDLHVWSISSNQVALSAHLIADNEPRALSAAHRLLEEKHKIHHMTIQIEDPAHFEPRFCYDCDNSREEKR